MKLAQRVIAALIVSLGMLAAVPSAGAAPAVESSPTDTRATARAAYPTRLKCNDNGGCTRLNRRLPTKFRATWSGVVENHTNRWIRGARCESLVSKSTDWELSTSLSAELKLGLFASVNATISGSVKKQMTSKIEFSVPFDVPPHTNTACKQGFVVYRWEALHFDRIRQSAYNFKVKAPRAVAWRIQDIG